MDDFLNITDEELREELERMGYSNIPEDVLKLFKKDLNELMKAEQANPVSPPDSLSPRATNAVPTCLNRLHNDSPQRDIEKTFANMSITSPGADTMPTSSKKMTPNSLMVPKSRISSAGHRSLLSSSTVSRTSTVSGSTPRVIKRKILRQKDGESFIEEMSYVSNISSNAGDFAKQANAQTSPCPDFSYGLQRSKNISRSTGSLNDIGRSGARKPVRLPAVQYGVRSCDPVIRYHHYRQFWKTFKPPGEKSHKKLRWTIREQMLDYDPLVEFPKYTIVHAWRFLWHNVLVEQEACFTSVNYKHVFSRHPFSRLEGFRSNGTPLSARILMEKKKQYMCICDYGFSMKNCLLLQDTVPYSSS